MKLILLFISLCFVLLPISSLKYNYQDPLGRETQPDSFQFPDLGEDLSASEIVAKTAKARPTEKEIQKRRYARDHYVGRPGYVDPSMIYRATKRHRNPFHDFRFTEPEDEYVNPKQGSSDPNMPPEDGEAEKKEGESNGTIVFKKKRTLNFDTGLFPEFMKELKK